MTRLAGLALLGLAMNSWNALYLNFTHKSHDGTYNHELVKNSPWAGSAAVVRCFMQTRPSGCLGQPLWSGSHLSCGIALCFRGMAVNATREDRWRQGQAGVGCAVNTQKELPPGSWFPAREFSHKNGCS